MNQTGAIVLIVAGLAIIVWGAFGFRTQDKVVDIGPIHATKTTEHNIPYAPIAGGLVVIGGVVMLANGRK